MWLVCQADKSHVMSSLIFAEIRKLLWKCCLLNMLALDMAWEQHVLLPCDAFYYLISDQVATTCYLRKKLISNTGTVVIRSNMVCFCNISLSEPMRSVSILYLLQFCCSIYPETVFVFFFFFSDATVYVGGLDDKVSEAILWELFLQAGPVGKVLSFHLYKFKYK